MCDTIVVVGPDRVLFAKNSDRDPNESQVLDWQPRRTHAEGARVRCTWMEIPQASQTHGVLLSRPFWMFGAEMGANEHGVTIGNEAVFTRSPRQAIGLTGMDLVRLALERAATAEHAVAVIVKLLERHGQGGGCGLNDPDFTYDNSYIVADPTQAFVLETAGRDHAIELVSAGVRSISNGLTIPEFAPGRSQRIRTYFSRCRARRSMTEAGAAAAATAGDLMTVLRDHGGDVPHYSPITGGMGAPCMHAGGAVRSSQTTSSWVADLTSTEHQHWVTASAAPCTSIFKPVRVQQPMELGPTPTDHFDADTLWWRHEVLHRRCLTEPERLLPLLAPERDQVEAEWLANPPEPEEAFAEADAMLARWTERLWRDAVDDTRPRWARRYWQERNRLAGLPEEFPLRGETA